jgi:hypothetical protein
MIAYEWCMKVGAMPTPPPPLHWINNHNRDKECRVAKEKIVWQILEKFLVGVANEVKRMPMDQERMKGLAKIN